MEPTDTGVNRLRAKTNECGGGNLINGDEWKCKCQKEFIILVF